MYLLGKITNKLGTYSKLILLPNKKPFLDWVGKTFKIFLFLPYKNRFPI